MATVKTFTDNAYLATDGWFSSPWYEVPTGKRAIVKQLIICNTSTATHPVTIQTVASGGGAAGSDDCLFKDMVIDAKSTIVINCAIMMETGDRLWAFTDDFNVVSFRASGVEI